MKKIGATLQKIENAILVITFAIMVFSQFAAVLNRNFIKLPINWFDEAAIYSMIYMVLLGMETGLRDGSQISVTAVQDKLGGNGKRVLQIIAKIVVIIFSAGIFISSLELMQMQISSGQVSPALGLPMWVPYGALPLSFGIVVIVQAVALIKMILNFNKPSEENNSQEELS